MSQLRLNPLTGRWVTVTLERSARPSDLLVTRPPVEIDLGRPCPFCPGHEEATPPALEVYGEGGEWRIRVVPNLFPAFAGNGAMTVMHLGPVFTQAAASGIHEVLVLSAVHRQSWADFDDDQSALVMRAIRDRMEDHARSAHLRYSQAIVNHGREAGASLEHPHGQLLGLPFVPGEITDELAGFMRFQGSCLLCTTRDAEVEAGHRIVFEDEFVLVTCPFWSGVPYEMLVIPRAHGAHLDRAADDDLTGVGRAVRTALDRLRVCVGDLAYNVVFHTAPHHQREDRFHWHVHVLPRLTSVAGFEQGTGVLINIVPPERAARQLTALVEPA